MARALGSELTHHLGYPSAGAKPDDTSNHRDGTSGKTVITDDGPLPIDVPRDRAGTSSWRRAWTHMVPFFAFPPEVRKVVYTTNTLESVHAQLRKIIQIPAIFRMTGRVINRLRHEIPDTP